MRLLFLMTMLFLQSTKLIVYDIPSEVWSEAAKGKKFLISMYENNPNSIRRMLSIQDDEGFDDIRYGKPFKVYFTSHEAFISASGPEELINNSKLVYYYIPLIVNGNAKVDILVLKREENGKEKWNFNGLHYFSSGREATTKMQIRDDATFSVFFVDSRMLFAVITQNNEHYIIAKNQSATDLLSSSISIHGDSEAVPFLSALKQIKEKGYEKKRRLVPQ